MRPTTSANGCRRTSSSCFFLSVCGLCNIRMSTAIEWFWLLETRPYRTNLSMVHFLTNSFHICRFLFCTGMQSCLSYSAHRYLRSWRESA